MGCWREDIYSNDIAQDTLTYLEEAFDKYKDVDMAISEVESKEIFNYNESKLVMADFELDILGNTGNFYSIDDAIKEELKDINNWNNPIARKCVLDVFKNKLDTYSTNKINFDVKSSTVKKWLNSKRSLDIL